MKKLLLATAIVGALVAPAKAEHNYAIALSYRDWCGPLPGVDEKVDNALSKMSEDERWFAERGRDWLPHFVPRYDLPPSARNARHALTCEVWGKTLREEFHE